MNKKNIFLLMILSLLGTYFLYRPVLDCATQAGSYMIYPLLHVHSAITRSMEDCRYKQKTFMELRETIDTLKKECDALRAENTDLKAMLSYVKDTQELLVFKKSRDHEHDIMAHIIERYITEQEHYILIDVGITSHVTKDMIVITNGNNLIGRVSMVYPWYAKVQLITDPNSRIPVYITHSNARGIHKGMGLINETTVERINHLDTLSAGDDVWTSGEGTVFPRGYRLGTVYSKNRAGLYYETRVKPAVDPHALQYCLVHASHV